MAKVDNTVPKYRYENIQILSVYDADTCRLQINLGFGVVLEEMTFRFARINAWEVRGKEKIKGKIARDYLRERLNNPNGKISIETYKDAKGKYGRYLCDLYIGKECLNDTLVKLKHARYQTY